MEEKDFSVRCLGKKYSAFYIKSKDRALTALKILSKFNGIFGLDTETCAKKGCEHLIDPALSPILGEIRLLQIFDGTHTYLFDWRYLDPEIFREFLESKKFIAHNAIFDLGMLKAKGIHNINIGCTFIASKLLMHEKFPTDIGLSASLSSIFKMLFKEDVLKVLQASEWGADNLTFEQIEYAALDPICVSLIADKISPSLVKKGLVKVYNLYKESQHPIAEMHLNGIGFDQIIHKSLIEKWRGLLLAARSSALQATGLKEITSGKVAGWLQENLSDDLLRIWPKTPGGKLSTDKNTFKEFAHVKELAPLLEFNKYETLLSTFGPSLVSKVNPITKRLHANYNIAGARTGRMSCSKPNLQNQPAERTEADFRKIFVATPGNILVAGDFSQVEVRVIAELSQDNALLNIYKQGQDVYVATAQRVLGKLEISKLERQQMKAVVLGRLFGLGAAKFAQYAKTQYDLDISEEEAHAFIEGFKQAYPQLTQWQYDQGSECEYTLKAKTIFGKVRALDKDSYYGAGLNVPVQGSACEIMLCAMNRFYKDKRKNFLLLGSIHDEIITEVPMENRDEASKLLHDCMYAGYLDVFPKGVTTNLVEIKSGNNWSECK